MPNRAIAPIDPPSATGRCSACGRPLDDLALDNAARIDDLDGVICADCLKVGYVKCWNGNIYRYCPAKPNGESEGVCGMAAKCAVEGAIE